MKVYELFEEQNEELTRNLQKLGFAFYKENSDGSVDIWDSHQNVIFNLKTIDIKALDLEMPKIDTFSGTLFVIFDEVNDFTKEPTWLPNKVTKQFKVKSGSGPKNLIKYLPQEIGTTLALDLPLTSLKGIGDRVKKCELIIVPGGLKSHILGLLKIKNLEIVSSSGIDASDDDWKAVKIINKYLDSNRNINKCRAELEDAGLEEYAQF